MRKTGFALVAVLAVLTLLTVLAMTTMSLTTRLQQSATLAERDLALGGAAAAAIAAPIRGWRQGGYATMAIGDTRLIEVPAPLPTRASITRLGAELFWIVGEVTAIDGTRRRENLIVRLALPTVDSLPGLVVGGGATLSRSFIAVDDSFPGCTGSGADITLRTDASLTAADGLAPGLRVVRADAATDSGAISRLGGVPLDELGRTADVDLPSGSSISAPSGVTHARGDLTITGGSGAGVLVVEGRLTLRESVRLDGVVFARQLVVEGDSVELSGAVRVAAGNGSDGSVSILGAGQLRRSRCAVQKALAASVTPRPVAGRKWAELY